MKSVWALGASASALLGVMVPMAPTSAAALQASDDDGDVVIVSARRREESLQDVPLAVTATTAEELDAIGAIDITAVQRLTPNATIEVARGTNSTLIAFIRGVGQQDPLWGFEPGVGVYIDDVFVARPQGAVLDIFDIDRIEVLRGPQGTLYGRNTIGGAIKYVTREPSLDKPEFRARVDLGSYGQFDQILSGSVPLSNTFAISGAIADYDRDGFGTNLNTGAEHYNKDIRAYRVGAFWQPTDNFKVRITADETEDNSNAKHGHRLLPSADGTIPVTDNIYDTRAGLGDDNRVETRGASLTAEWEVSDALTLKSISAYRESETVTPIDFDALPQPDFDVPAFYDDDQQSHELQALFNVGKFSGVAGVYYLDGTASGAFDVILGGFGLTIYQAGEQQKENIAVYADVTYDITEQWSLSVGGRYTEDKTTADVTRERWFGLGSGSFDSDNTASVLFTTDTNFENLERTDDKFTPRVSLSWKPADNFTTYASYSEGFKAGGFDPRAQANADPLGLTQEGFGPETVKSYEIGAKGSFINGRLTYAVAAFLADYRDQQISVQQGADLDDDGVNDTFVSSVFNAGESEYKGVEVETALELTDSLTLTGVMGWIDAEIEEIISAGENIADQFVTQNTPELTGRVGIIWEVPRPILGGNLTFNGSAEYRDGYNLTSLALPGFAPGTNPSFPEGGPPLDPDAYTLLNLSAIWTSEDDHWRVGLYGRNLTDEEYEVAAYNFASPDPLGVDSVYSAFYGAPATFTASVEYRY
ncbi:MAG: TonB-dependent receptor [Pseudomonadota bacterium]